MAAAQIDGTNADNIIVGSGAGVPSQVRVYQIPLALSSSAGPALFATFKPYGEDRSGVTVATGFVDFSTGRESIVTAPVAGSPTEVKVFAFPLLEPIAKTEAKADHDGMHAMEEAVNTASFTPLARIIGAAFLWPRVGSPVRSAAPSGSWRANLRTAVQ